MARARAVTSRAATAPMTIVAGDRTSVVARSPRRQRTTDWADVVARFKMALGDRVTEVRESQLLVDSPARLISTNTGFEREMQRVRRIIEEDYKAPPKILELNRNHPLIRGLAGRIQSDPTSSVIDDGIALLFDILLLGEGLHPNPAEIAPRAQTILERALK